jgi:LacI family transcriptional regulator
MATIKDVARIAGVGLGTASRVVSGRGSVAPATAARVKKAIRQLDFHPSHAARSLHSGSTQMIGVYIPMLKGTFYTPILQVIDTGLRDAGRHMVVAFGQGTGDERRQAIEGVGFLMDRECDGLVVLSNALREKDVVTLRRRQPNLVMLNRELEGLHDICFCADHAQGGVAAAQALLGRGHRQVAIISGPATSPDNVARVGGFLGEIARAGLDPGSVPMLESDFSPEGGWDCARRLVESGSSFTALFCANDEMAVGALSWLRQAGIDVPGRISVLGYDDTHSAEFSAPRLTSVHIPMREVTLCGLHSLLNRCYGASFEVHRDFPVRVTWRESVAEAPAGAGAAPGRARRAAKAGAKAPA